MSLSRFNPHLLGVFAATTMLFAAATTSANADMAAMCATPDQAKQIQDFYKTKPGTIPAIANATLKLPDAVIASGLPADQSYGTNGEKFVDVWKSLMAWETPVVIIIKSGSVMEVRGPIREGIPSTRSNYFNVDEEDGDGFAGHLRPDMVGVDLRR